MAIFYSVTVEQHSWTWMKQIWLCTKGIALCLKLIICFKSQRRFFSTTTALRAWKAAESALSHVFLLRSIKAGWWQVYSTPFSSHLCHKYEQQWLQTMQTILQNYERTPNDTFILLLSILDTGRTSLSQNLLQQSRANVFKCFTSAATAKTPTLNQSALCAASSPGSHSGKRKEQQNFLLTLIIFL